MLVSPRLLVSRLLLVPPQAHRRTAQRPDYGSLGEAARPRGGQRRLAPHPVRAGAKVDRPGAVLAGAGTVRLRAAQFEWRLGRWNVFFFQAFQASETDLRISISIYTIRM